MDRIRIVGGNELNGEIPISGAKNAALPLMIACLLTKEPLTLNNVPRLADVKQLERILENHGVDLSVQGRRRGEDEMRGQRITFSAADIVDTCAPYELGLHHARKLLGNWCLGGARRRGTRFDAWRVRNRHASG